MTLHSLRDRTLGVIPMRLGQAGLGVAALLSLGRVDGALYVDPRTRTIYCV